jgi:hypothetical protein
MSRKDGRTRFFLFLHHVAASVELSFDSERSAAARKIMDPNPGMVVYLRRGRGDAVPAGGLLALGADQNEMFRRAASYVRSGFAGCKAS